MDGAMKRLHLDFDDGTSAEMTVSDWDTSGLEIDVSDAGEVSSEGSVTAIGKAYGSPCTGNVIGIRVIE